MHHLSGLIAAAILLSGASMLAGDFGKSVYVVGDSLSDNGNFTAVLGPKGPPWDHPAYDPDRFSNGMVWPDLLAIVLRTSIDASLQGGTNYSFGGATAARDTTFIPGTSGMDQAGDIIAAGGINPDAIYVVSIGLNDVAAGVIPGGEPAAVASATVDSIAKIVGMLHDAGARDIVVMNLLEIADAPLIEVLETVIPGVSARLVEAVAIVNEGIEELPASFPSARVRISDVFGLLKAVFSHPDVFGLENVTDPCVAGESVCPNPDRYFYWDGTHPTEAGHKLLAALVFFDITRNGNGLRRHANPHSILPGFSNLTRQWQ